MSKSMSSQRGQSLNNLLDELRELKQRMKQLLPQYTTALERVAQMPTEFERRWWLWYVETLLQRTKSDYRKYQDRTRQVEYSGDYFMPVMAAFFGVSGRGPTPPPRFGISISVSGKIEPARLDRPTSEKGDVFLALEEFEAICQRLKEEIIKGAVMPAGENEIPKLLLTLASKPSEKPHEP